uniref:Single domain-containing protein n=1 Tax=Amblyomma maculatum TaxID=34609 RepID=G3MQ07_AMBMU
MELLAPVIYILLQTAEILASATAVPADTVAFLKNTCQYKYWFFNGAFFPEEACERVVCYASQLKVTIERCASNISKGKSCHVSKPSAVRHFPFCCEVEICGNGQRSSYGTMTHYTALGKRVSSESSKMDATGHYITAVRYIYTACNNGSCSFKGQPVDGETDLSSPCKKLTTPRRKSYVMVQSCPKYDRKIHACIKLQDGDRSLEYPMCCPEYMCPPEGSVTKTMKEETWTRIEKGNCIYEKKPISGEITSEHPCQKLKCNTNNRTVSKYSCFDEAERNWTRCQVAPSEKPPRGSFPSCCPPLICPYMLVENGLPDPSYYKSKVKVDVCIYGDRFFRDAIAFSEPCEKWVCYARRRQVKILRCQSIEQELKRNCSWEYKDRKRQFPECCKKKVCRDNYRTHFPGTRVALSIW